MPESMTTFTVAFADDEPMGRMTLKVLLEKDPQIQVVAECANGMQVVKAVRELAPQILFLDVQMPGMTGFEVLKELEEESLPVIVFATAFDRYAVQAFDKSAADYLLKPFDDERFVRALERAKERVQQGTEAAGTKEVVSEYDATIEDQQGAEGGPVERLQITREGHIDYLKTKDLLWVEAADQYVMLYSLHGEFLMRESMGHLERALDPACFKRIHRSAIVAIPVIRALERQAGGTGRVQVSDDKWLPVSRSRYTALKALLAAR
jgi:two-component system LytT family response regulator